MTANMMWLTSWWRNSPLHQPISLRLLLLVPVVAQILGIVGIVGYLSYRSGQQAVEDLAHQLMEETGDHIVHDLDIYLQTAHRINQSNIAALESGAISLDRLDQLHRYLILQHWQVPEFTTQLLGTPQGHFRTIHWVSPAEVETGLTQLQPTDLPFEAGRADANDPSQLVLYAIDIEGNLVRYLETIENIDVRERPWYRRAVETGTIGWSEPFQIGASNLLTINAYAPFYNASQQLEGVFSVNLSLERLNDFLKMLSVSENGQVFIMERNGLLIADSIELPVYVLSDVESDVESDYTQREPSAAQPGQLEFRRLSASESSDPVMRAAAQQLETSFGSLDVIQSAQELQIHIDDNARSEGLRQRHFLSAIPYQDSYGLDWLIVAVVPESDFMAQIHANVQRTVLLCIAALVGAIALAIWTVRKVSHPILALNRAIQDFADNHSHSSISPTQIREIESLRQTFHWMVTRLDDSFQALKASEQRFSTFVESVPMGVSVHNALGQVVFINQQGRDILPLGATPTLPEHLSQVYQLYLAGTDQLYPTDQLPAVRGIRGEKAYIDDMEIEVNGRRIPIEVHTIPIFDEAGQVCYAISAFQDISERRQLEAECKRAQDILTHYSRTLETEVAQKTEALRRSEALLNEAQRIAKIGSWSWNLVSDERWWSPQMYEVVGLNPDDYAVPPDVEVTNQNIHPADRERVNQATNAAIEQGIAYEIEFRILRPDSSITDAFSRGLVERNLDGRVARFWGITQDISDRKQLEQELIQHRDFRELIFNESNDALFLVNIATVRTVDCNRRAVELFEAESKDELIDIEGHTLQKRPFTSDELDAIQQQLDQQGFWNMEVEYITRKGREFWGDLSAKRITFGEQQFNLVRVVDISDRKYAELAFAQESSRRKILFDTSIDGIVVLDEAGTIIEANASFANMLGYSLDEITTLNLVDFDAHWTHEELERKIEESDLCHNTFETRHRRKDGSIYHVEISSNPVDWHGQSVQLCICRDISERKQAELELQHTTQQLQAFLDNAPAIISLFDVEGRYLQVNPACVNLFGMPGSRLVGHTFTEFFPESTVTLFRSRIQTLIETRQPLEVEDEIYLNGDRRIFQSILFPVVTLSETPTTFWAIATDITDRKAVEQMKDEFISIVSHELRTPLTAIHGSLGLLAAGTYDNNPTKAKHMLDIAAIDCDRLVRLVNEVLTLERLESNRLQMEKTVCDAADLIQQAVDGMQAIAEQASVTIAVEPISAQIWANPDAILQTLTNLLSNAIKFSPAQSTVLVAADIETNRVVFRVSDRGRGIPPDKLTTIFERFQQVDASDSRQKGGTGLGLAICQSFIAQHGGTIWAESVVGEGSTFFFTVPIAKTDAP